MLRKGELERESEILYRAARKQATRTSSVECSIDKISETLLCRLSKKISKVSHTSLAPPLSWQRTNTKKGMIK